MGKFIKYSATIDLSKVVTKAMYGKLFFEAIVHYRVNAKPKSQTLPLIDY
jgi:hypothetical protein